MDAAILAVLSELDGLFQFGIRTKNNSVEKMFLLHTQTGFGKNHIAVCHRAVMMQPSVTPRTEKEASRLLHAGCVFFQM